MIALVSEYMLEFFTLLNARGKKELIEWCMKEGLIASSYECPKCNEQMGLNERKSVVLDGFEWRCRKKGVNMHYVCRSIRKNSWFSNSKLIGNIKRFLRNHTSHVEGMFDHYLAEYLWRRSRDHSLSDETFQNFLKAVVTLYQQ
ncbi:uncharacterized protein TNCV_5029331 [Trichonephila clavipes]|nr:uncharacterized protein TNCV_5029331 [Trichonephila clavipes]